MGEVSGGWTVFEILRSIAKQVPIHGCINIIEYKSQKYLKNRGNDIFSFCQQSSRSRYVGYLLNTIAEYRHGLIPHVSVNKWDIPAFLFLRDC